MPTAPWTVPIKNVGFIDLFKALIIFFRFILKRWIILSFVFFMGGAIGFIYAFYQKSIYEASLTFSLEENNPPALLSLSNQFGINIGFTNSSIFNGDNILSIIKSRKIIESVLLEIDSTKKPFVSIAEKFIEIYDNASGVENRNYVKNLYDSTSLKPRSFNYLQDSVLFFIYTEIVGKYLKAIRPDKLYNLYEIKFRSADEKFSKLFVEKLIAATVNYYVALRTNQAKINVEAMEERVESLRGATNKAIENSANTQDANINPAFAQQDADIQKQQLSVTTYGAAYNELFTNLETARYQYLKDVPLLQIIDEVNYPLHKIKKNNWRTALSFSFVFVVIAVFSIIFFYQYRNLKLRLKKISNY